MIAKNGDWWTGVIGDRNGVFPFNYVEAAPEAAPEVSLTTFHFVNVCNDFAHALCF